MHRVPGIQTSHKTHQTRVATRATHATTPPGHIDIDSRNALSPATGEDLATHAAPFLLHQKSVSFTGVLVCHLQPDPCIMGFSHWGSQHDPLIRIILGASTGHAGRVLVNRNSVQVAKSCPPTSPPFPSEPQKSNMLSQKAQ